MDQQGLDRDYKAKGFGDKNQKLTGSRKKHSFCDKNSSQNNPNDDFVINDRCAWKIQIMPINRILVLTVSKFEVPRHCRQYREQRHLPGFHF
jgi:hypothetical protein